MIKEFISGQDPSLSEDLEQIFIETKRGSDYVDIYVVVKMEDIFEFQETFSNMIDEILGNKV